MPASIDPGTLAVSNLEQVGALASRLVHDLANHLCIISGNATFAELVPDDRVRVGDAVRSIVQASEEAGRLLSRCSELRERLLEGTPSGTVAEILETLAQQYGPNSPWRLSLAADLEGRVPLPARWVALAVRQILAETRTDHGAIHVERFVRPAEEYASSAPPGPEFLLIRIGYEAAAPIVFKELKDSYRNYSLLAAYELIRNSGGRTEFTTLTPPRGQEARIHLPLKN
jgi:hypothetical protein